MSKKVNNCTSNKWKYFMRHMIKNDTSKNYMFASRRCTPTNVSYPVFIPKPSTHRMHDLGSNVPHIQPKEFTENQMS
jgi:hypothetical protein